MMALFHFYGRCWKFRELRLNHLVIFIQENESLFFLSFDHKNSFDQPSKKVSKSLNILFYLQGFFSAQFHNIFAVLNPELVDY